jgi:hypothetical protein
MARLWVEMDQIIKVVKTFIPTEICDGAHDVQRHRCNVHTLPQVLCAHRFGEWATSYFGLAAAVAPAGCRSGHRRRPNRRRRRAAGQASAESIAPPLSAQSLNPPRL